MHSATSLPRAKSAYAAQSGPRGLSRDLSQQSSNLDDAAYYLDEERQRALRELDAARFGGFHTRVVIVSGIGFMAEAYDVFAISIASSMLGYIYGANVTTPASVIPPLKQLSSGQDLALKLSTSVGTLLGHLVFGWAGDIVGRKRMYGYELAVITIATFSQALAGSARGLNIIAVLGFWRFMMGFGVGGDYPLSAVLTSEFASIHIRGRMMAAVFAFQGIGNFLASVIAIIVVASYRHSELKDEDPCSAIEPMWRLLIGLGCIPSVVAMYFRLTIPESPRFTMDIERNVRQASQDLEQYLTTGTNYADPDAVVLGRSSAPAGSRREFFKYFLQWRNAKGILGASWSWLAADVAFYGLGLNTSVFAPFELVSKTAAATQAYIADNLMKICTGNLILATGLIPGSVMTFFFIDRIGRKRIQFLGFGALIVIFCIMGFAFDKLIPDEDLKENSTHLAHPAFVFLFCLGNFFQNFGPNVTTFVIPAEIFPTRYRTTAYGITAAFGKLGAILSQIMFTMLENRGGQNKWVQHFFPIYALFMLSGLLATFLIPETNGIALEDISSEGDIDGTRMASFRPRESEAEASRLRSHSYGTSFHSTA